jgi:rubredoxin
VKPYRGPPATLGSTAAAGATIVVWCKACGHQVEPDPGELAARYGPETSVLDWHKRLVCSRCGRREIDFVLTGARR